MALVTPSTTTAFHNSIGVNTHYVHAETPYNDWPRICDVLASIGISRLRDDGGFFPNPDYQAYREEKINHAISRGFKFLFGIGGEIPPPPEAVGTTARIHNIATKWGAATLGLEGPNEYDREGDPNYPQTLRDWTPMAFNRIRTYRQLDYKPLLGANLTNVYDNPSGPTLVGDLTPWIDRANWHPYTSATSPTVTLLNDLRSRYYPMFKSDTIWATEAGFHNATNYTPGGNQYGISESGAAIYHLRTLLEHFKYGIPQTFLYETIDQYSNPALNNPEQNFGLLRHNYSLKPAATAIKNLITLLGPDGNPPRTPLDITIDNPNVRSLVLRRSDNAYLVCLWQTTSVWDRVAKTNLNPPLLAFNMTMPKAWIAQVASPCASATWSSVTVNPTTRNVVVWMLKEPLVFRVFVEP